MKQISTTKKNSSWYEKEIFLPYTPPLDWKSLLDYFINHEISGTEKTTNHSYERVFEINGIIGFLYLTHHINEPALTLKIWIPDTTIVSAIVARVRKMFDLDLDYTLMLSYLNSHTLFKDITQIYPALRVAKGWDVFETIVLTILGQVVSVKRAKDLMKELVINHGIPIEHPISKEMFFLFPTPTQLANANLTHLGTTQARKESLKIISLLLRDKTIDLYNDHLEIIKEKLLAIPGIGKWSVEYIALRGFGHEDAFPETDLALKRVINYYPEFNIDAISPWRSYAAIYMWKDYMNQPEKYKERRL